MVYPEAEQGSLQASGGEAGRGWEGEAGKGEVGRGSQASGQKGSFVGGTGDPRVRRMP